MNRERKYRGYSEQLNKWLYGSLVTGLFENTRTKEDCPIIIDPSLYPDYSCLADFDDMDCEVLAASVGEFVGLKDKNGVEIYEGDVMEFNGNKSIVTYIPEVMGFQLVFPEDNKRMPIWYCDNGALDLELLGNIYQHPSLLHTKQ